MSPGAAASVRGSSSERQHQQGRQGPEQWQQRAAVMKGSSTPGGPGVVGAGAGVVCSRQGRASRAWQGSTQRNRHHRSHPSACARWILCRLRPLLADIAQRLEAGENLYVHW